MQCDCGMVGSANFNVVISYFLTSFCLAIPYEKEFLRRSYGDDTSKRIVARNHSHLDPMSL
jgi:hypothetical protein